MNNTVKNWLIMHFDHVTLTILFVVVFFIGWYFNGYRGARFDLFALMSMYGLLAGKNVVTHTINSLYNSPRGESPVPQKKEGDV